MSRSLLGIGLLLASTVAAAAQGEAIALGPVTGGACTLAATPAAIDGNAISVFFADAVVVQAGGGLASTGQASCAVSVQVDAPAGMRVAVSGLDFAGSMDLVAGARASLRTELFTAGSAGPVINRNFAGPLVGPYSGHADVLAGSMSWSPCGGPFVVNANVRLSVTANAAGEAASASLGGADGAALVLRFASEEC